MIKQFDPHDVAAVAQWIRAGAGGHRYMRLLAFMPVQRSQILCAYSCREPDPELEAEIVSEGGSVIGYYRPPLDPMQLMADLVETWQEKA